jgi:lipoyl(octanoyl) transferase
VILWCDGAHGARENMRRDAALLQAVADGTLAEPLLRLFRFVPAGITLGHSQDPQRELDLEAAKRDSVEWAVRPTGGRAIYHDQEWTFSLATPLDASGWAGDPASAYARTCAVLAAALRALGVPAERSAGSPRGVGAPRAPGGPAAPCFASTARHELTLEGRKLAGIAQRAVRGGLLQQGSLLLGESHLLLARYLRVPAEQREAARAALASAAVHAGGYLAADAPLERLADALGRELPGARRLDGAAGDAFAAG